MRELESKRKKWPRSDNYGRQLPPFSFVDKIILTKIKIYVSLKSTKGGNVVKQKDINDLTAKLRKEARDKLTDYQRMLMKTCSLKYDEIQRSIIGKINDCDVSISHSHGMVNKGAISQSEAYRLYHKYIQIAEFQGTDFTEKAGKQLLAQAAEEVAKTL